MTEPRVLNKRKHGEPEGSVYVGRPSKWGNPYPIPAGAHDSAEARRVVIERFEAWLQTQPKLMAAAKRELKGKDLVCWCAPKACHAEVLLRIANEEEDVL